MTATFKFSQTENKPQTEAFFSWLIKPLMYNSFPSGMVSAHFSCVTLCVMNNITTTTTTNNNNNNNNNELLNLKTSIW